MIVPLDSFMKLIRKHIKIENGRIENNVFIGDIKVNEKALKEYILDCQELRLEGSFE